MSETDSLPAVPTDDAVALTRDDLAASIAAYRLGSQSSAMWRPVYTMFGGVLLGAMLITAVEWWGGPSWLQPLFFASGVGIALGGFVTARRRNRRLLAECQWNCPQCETPLIAGAAIAPTARAEMAVASGHCPVCGERLLTR